MRKLGPEECARPRALLRPAKDVISAWMKEPEAVVTTGGDLGHAVPSIPMQQSQEKKTRVDLVPRREAAEKAKTQADALGSERKR